MRLGQVKWNGAVTAAIFDVCSARPIPDYTLCDLILRGEKEGESLPALALRLASRQPVSAHPLIPLHPREVWAAGATYAASAAARDAALSGASGYHQQAHRASRPEFVFKGTARVCVGPGQCIGIRPDSDYTAPEPELAAVLGAKGRILGYTLANDVTARDLEYENPFYIAQAKSYSASCALGPVMITADEIPDPHALELSVHIHRNGEQIFAAQVSTSDLVRKLETMIDYLLRANPVPPGSVLLTGSGIMVHRGAALAHGDSVTIRMPQLGELTNTAAVLN
ncbi:MAG TPA: fumarylacetoacetate hydrolase family protein [Bryobacteraceae bacterium]|nr:fumarylacetoacetate hydrolase family protein [Bryobacteraceae bacterium]